MNFRSIPKELYTQNRRWGHPSLNRSLATPQRLIALNDGLDAVSTEKPALPNLSAPLGLYSSGTIGAGAPA